MAADLTLVLMTTMGLGLARACPVPTTTRKGFDIGMFKSLLPNELVAFKKAKDGNSLKDWNCSSRLFPRTRDLRQLQVSWESQACLVLGTVANSSLDHILDQTLHTLHHIHSKLQACVSARGTRAISVGSGQMGPRPSVPSPVSHTTFLCSQVQAQPTAGSRPQEPLPVPAASAPGGPKEGE
uniref:Uncharacterized protein n=1 Tax=Monodon monoceros TaxID=40151 RepID=A0A8C6AG90_MONMO